MTGVGWRRECGKAGGGGGRHGRRFYTVTDAGPNPRHPVLYRSLEDCKRSGTVASLVPTFIEGAFATLFRDQNSKFTSRVFDPPPWEREDLGSRRALCLPVYIFWIIRGLRGTAFFGHGYYHRPSVFPKSDGGGV